MKEANGNKILIDTNIIIYILLWNEEYINKIINKEIYFSFVSKLEVLWYNFENSDDEIKAKEFFEIYNQLNLNNDLESLIILIKKKYKIKLPDSIILSTAIYNNLDLLTNDKDLIKIYNKVLVNEEIINKVKLP